MFRLPSASSLVAGNEKVWIGLIAVLQAYAGAVDWLVEPEKALVIGILGLGQIWLGTNTPKETHNEVPSDPSVLLSDGVRR